MKSFGSQYWEDDLDFGLDIINFITLYIEIHQEGNSLDKKTIIGWRETEVFTKTQHVNFVSNPKVFWKKDTQT